MTKTNLPAPTATTAVAVASEWDELRAEFDDGSDAFKEAFGLTIPRLKTDFGKNGRGWIDPLSGEAFDALEIVILAYPPSRAFWLKSLDDSDEVTPPDCKSFDMIRPDSNVPEATKQADTCAKCPHSQFTAGDDGAQNQRPRCTESINVVAYDVPGDRYVWLRFSGTSIKPFKDWISYLTSKKLAAFQVTTVVTTDVVKKGSKEWLVAKFAKGRDLTVDEVRPMRQIAKSAMEAWKQASEEMAHVDASRSGPFDDDTVVDGEVVDTTPFGPEDETLPLRSKLGAREVDADGEEVF